MNDRELSLAQQVCEGDREAFRQIVESNKKKIFYLSFDLTGSVQDAEDLSQEVFMKAFRFLHQFKGKSSLRSWLYRITLNTFLDQKRKKSVEIDKNQQKLDGQVSASFSLNSRSSTPNPEKFAESRQIQDHIEQPLEKLSLRERTVFVMRHYQGMSGKEVGILLNISEGTVKSLLFRAIKKLQKALQIYKDSLTAEVYQ